MNLVLYLELRSTYISTFIFICSSLYLCIIDSQYLDDVESVNNDSANLNQIEPSILEKNEREIKKKMKMVIIN